jgi:predicted MFS family arabinose efflux permease
MRRDLAILRDRRFGLLFAARTASVLGSAFGPLALAFGVLAVTDDDAAILSVVVAAEAISMVVFMLLGGVVADRLPRFKVMMVADLAAAAGWGGLAAMFITGWAPVPMMVAFSALAGMATAMYWPAMTGIVPEVVAAERLQSANGVLRLGMNGARIGGFAVAGGCVALIGAGWTLALNAGLLVASAVLVAFLRLPPVRPTGSTGHDAERTSMFRDLHDGWKEFRSRQWLWVVVLQYSFIIMVLQAVFGVLGPVLANERLGGARGWSWVLGAEALGMLLGVVIALRVRPRRPVRLVVIMTFPLCLLPLVLGLGAHLVVAVAAAFLAGVALDVLSVVWETTMQREIPQTALSRVSSYDALGSLMLGPVGLLVAGPAVVAIGAGPSMLVSAAVVVLASVAALCSPGVRGLRWSAAMAEGRAEPEPTDGQNPPLAADVGWDRQPAASVGAAPALLDA